MRTVSKRALAINCVVSAVIVGPAYSVAKAQVDPPEALPPGIACGFVETSFTDPKWVMVTSGRILRANLCLDSCNKPSYDRWTSPCDAGTRFWKFLPDEYGAWAYPIKQLALAKSVYVRSGVTFRV
jgi:hypothetical protein